MDAGVGAGVDAGMDAGVDAGMDTGVGADLEVLFLPNESGAYLCYNRMEELHAAVSNEQYPEERVMGHMSFRLKLTLVFIVTVMIEGALIGGFSYFHSRDIVVKNKKRRCRIPLTALIPTSM